VKFLIEGEEEIGSPNLEPFIDAEADMLACDAVVVSDTAMFDKKIPSIVHGLRGLTYMQVDVRGTNRDLHSGQYGGAVANPAFALATMIAKLKDDKGRVKIPGFYDKVRKLTAADRKAIAALPHSDGKFKKSIGAPDLFGETGFTTLERLWARPTVEVNGIWGGFSGEGAKTVIPAEAHAKISMRLVPDHGAGRSRYRGQARLRADAGLHPRGRIDSGRGDLRSHLEGSRGDDGNRPRRRQPPRTPRADRARPVLQGE
jgi:acetylornithine deacetylase/succinyl-diaminopimelate desuccinylase-like protein